MTLLLLAAALARASALGSYQLPPAPASVPGVAHYGGSHAGHDERLRQAGLTDPEIRDIHAAWAVIQQSYLGRISFDEAVENAVIGIGMGRAPDARQSALKGLAALDPYSGYMTPQEYEEYEKENKRSVVADYGLWFRERLPGRPIIVDAVSDGSPGAQAGLQPGDEITAVNGKAPSSLSYGELRGLYVPRLGDRVQLTVSRYPDVLQVQLVAADIPQRTVYHRMLNSQTGYVQLGAFEGSVSKDFEAALDDLASRGMTSVIVDLRQNPGGRIDRVIECLELIMPRRVLLTTFEDRKVSHPVVTDKDGRYRGLRMAVLVNGMSASAAELFAAAVQENGRARLIGERTFGKGVGQGIFPFKGGALRLTTAWWLTPRGRSVSGKGVQPDTVVSLSDDDQRAVENRLHRQLTEKAVDFAGADPVIMAAFRP